MNKIRTFLLWLLSMTCIIIFVGGCATTMKLQYSKPSFKEMNKGTIYVVIDDQRPPEEGGNDPTRVGTIRNNFGMPFALRASAAREPSKVIKQMASDCLKAAGYKVAGRSDSSGELHLMLQSFWSDGYQHNRIWTKIAMELRKDKNSPPAWEHIVESNMGATWTVGYGPFNKGINRMLEDVKSKMIAAFKDQQFQESLESL